MLMWRWSEYGRKEQGHHHDAGKQDPELLGSGKDVVVPADL